MELHRLKPMGDYDPEVFNEIFKKVQPLVKRLTREISPRAVGYPPDIIESWFHDKIIFVFNKYKEEPENIIKAKILSSLSNFKNRILKKAYEEQTCNNLIDLGEENEIENILPYEEEDQTKEILLSLVSEFMKNHLTQEAYLIFELESFPPEYIRARTKSRISGKLLVEYLGLPDTSTSVKYVNELRDEVKDTLLEARNYFSNNTPYVFS